MNIKKVLEFMRSTKFNDFILNILLIVVMIMVGILLYWQIYPYNILEEKEGNYLLDKTVYKQGEDFNIHFEICKKMDFEEDVYGRFVDGVIYSIPENGSNFDIGCYSTYISSVSIPETLPEGNYIYEETIIYRVNPIRVIEYTFTTPEFRVVE